MSNIKGNLCTCGHNDAMHNFGHSDCNYCECKGFVAVVSDTDNIELRGKIDQVIMLELTRGHKIDAIQALITQQCKESEDELLLTLRRCRDLTEENQRLEARLGQQCNQARIDELQALRAGRSYKVGADYRIIPPKGDVRLFYDEFDIDGRIAELQAKETEEE
jgi:hypothetical protein